MSQAPPPTLAVQRRPRGATWVLLCAALLACQFPLLRGLSRPDTSEVMEQFALVSAQETWMRQKGGERNAWVIPTLFGQPRLAKPPLTVWLHLLAWRDLPRETPPQVLLGRARLVAVGMGLLMLTGVFWLGRTLWDGETACLATLIAGSTWFFQKQARIASYDIHMAAWATLAVAAAAWALRPLGEFPSRRRELIGWLMAGAFLAAGLLSKGPLTLLVVGAGVASICLVDRSFWVSDGPLTPVVGFAGVESVSMVNRSCLRRTLVGCPIALAVAAALVLPWYFYAWHTVPDAWLRWRAEYGIEVAPRPAYYYLGLLGLVLPWTLWLVGGFFQPFRADGELRRRLLVPWIWFFLILIVFTLHPARRFRYILPIVPAASLLIAQVFREHQALADQGVVEREARRLWVPHWVGMSLASLAVLPLIACQPWLVRRGWLPETLLSYEWSPWLVGILTCIALTILAAAGWWAHLRWKPLVAGGLTALWALVLTAVFWQGYAAAEHARNDLRPAAEKIGQIIGDAPTRSLLTPGRLFFVDRAILFYSRIVAPPITAAELGAFIRSAPDVYVIAEAGDENDAVLRQAGLVLEGAFRDGKDNVQRVWASHRLR